MFHSPFKLRNLTAALMACGAIVATGTPALAAVTILTDDAALQQHASQRGEYFSQSGLSGEEAQPIAGAGQDMSLSLATKIIVPKNWVVHPSGQFNEAVVTWQGGVAWSQILRSIAQQEGIFINLDWVKKIVSINVPGSARHHQQVSQVQQQQQAQQRDAYELKRATEWQRRNELKQELTVGKAQVDDLIAKQRQAQEYNQDFIARLNKDHNASLEENAKLKALLQNERALRDQLEQKYAVINPGLGESEKVDATTLFPQYKNRWILPFDSSFEYFLKGGHADLLMAETPASYFAKPGTAEEVIRAWADQLGWHLEYRAKVRHKNPYEVKYQGSFYEAGRAFIKSFRKSRRPLNITFLPDVKPGEGKQGLVIVSDLNFKTGK